MHAANNFETYANGCHGWNHMAQHCHAFLHLWDYTRSSQRLKQQKMPRFMITMVYDKQWFMQLG